MPRIKKTKFAFDWERFETFAREKSGGKTMPDAVIEFGISSPGYYHQRRTATDFIPVSKLIWQACENMGLTLNEIRSLIIEIK